jgi:hypothetical protein
MTEQLTGARWEPSDAQLSKQALLKLWLLNVAAERRKTREEIKTARAGSLVG